MLSRPEMLRALQADVNAWPQRVRDAGVTKRDGAAYVPLPRNIGVLRTPDDPEATYAYMVSMWSGPDAEQGSDGWFRIIAQAGPEHTWEWLMVDPEKPYAPLFADELRTRVRRALEADSGHAVWTNRKREAAAAERANAERIERIREEMRSGRRKRVAFPEFDSAR